MLTHEGLDRHQHRQYSLPQSARTRSSEDEQYDIPEEYAALNEVAEPPPVENPEEGSAYFHVSLEDETSQQQQDQDERRVRRQEAVGELPGYMTRPKRHSRQSHNERGISQRLDPELPERVSESSEEYDVPDAFSNLDEVAVPGPVENPDEDPIHRHYSLEEQLSRTSQRSRLEHILPPQGLRDVEKQPRRGRPSARTRLVSRAITEAYTISYLIFFSILGTLARLGLEALTTYPGAPIGFTTLWMNFAGTLILGYLAEASENFNPVAKNRGRPKQPEPPSSDESGQTEDTMTPAEEDTAEEETLVRRPSPLYIGLATGFCGSLTTFSSFVRDIFLALSNSMGSAPPERNAGQDIMALLAVAITTVGLCLSALKLGAHIAIATRRLSWTLTHDFLAIFDNFVLVLGIGSWIGAVIMTVLPPDRPFGPSNSNGFLTESWRGLVLFSLVFAPIGTLTRFYISIKLNALHPAFPLGTFTANIFGTAVLGMAWDLQHGSLGSLVGCQVLQGIMDGYCGCLTTVSTWTAELSSLRRRHAYIYGMVTLGTALALLIVIMGTQKWTVGWTELVCRVN